MNFTQINKRLKAAKKCKNNFIQKKILKIYGACIDYTLTKGAHKRFSIF